MNARTVSAMAGFLVLGLSPSFLDWKQSPDKKSRQQFFLYYGVALLLIWFGIQGRNG